MEGSCLSDQPISKKQEEKLRKLAKDLFLNEYPNPERKGCPDSETIRAIALGKLTGEEASRWHVHAAACSPCNREYVNFRTAAERDKRVRAVGLVAAVAVLIVVVGLAVVNKFAARPAGVGVIAWVEGWRSARLDLRGHEALRGGEPGPPLPPLALPRGKLVLILDLPVGSEPGHYDVELQQPRGETVARAGGTAMLVNGLTVLRILIDTRQPHPGLFSLTVQRSGQSLSEYTVYID